MDQLAHLEQLIRQFAPQIVIYGLMSLGALIIAAGAYVSVTPSLEDDHWLNSLYEKPVIGFLIKLIVAFSPVIKKDGGLQLSNKVSKDA